MANDGLKTKAAASWYVASLVAVTMGLYLAACCLPATDLGDSLDFGTSDAGPYEPPAPSPGWMHVVFGVMSGKGLPAWSANIVLCAGVVCLILRRIGAATALGVAATVLGLTTLTAFKYNHVYSGYYVWQTSHTLFAVGSCVGFCWLRSEAVADSRSRCSKEEATHRMR